jgi:excisionase family DNA binding protein
MRASILEGDGVMGRLCIIDDLAGAAPTAEQAALIAEHLRKGHALLSGSPLLTAEGAASYLKVPVSFVRRETLAGRLRSMILGARYRRYALSDLDQFANRGRSR